ncbi:hypothetical protein L6R50_21495 [Myxococcota bacterium]|nr:hypothetical protein [Myxococcota bacterium]
MDLLFSLPPSPISREADGIRVLTPRLDLVFVFGSSTHALATNHAAFACDALWTHEIATVLQHRAPPDTKVYTHCRHDCDFLHEIKDPTSLMSRLQPHVVSMGMGDVNSVTAEIFRCHAHVDPDMEGDWVSPLQPRVYAPKSSVIIVSPTERLEPTDDRSFGWLCGVRSPFFDNRVSVICAGTNGTGTTAAAWALLQSLDLDAADHGWASLPVGNAVVIAREVAKSISRGDLVKIGGIRYMSVSGRPECVEWYEAHRSS